MRFYQKRTCQHILCLNIGEKGKKEGYWHRYWIGAYYPKFVMDDTMCAEWYVALHIGHGPKRHKGRIGAEASVQGRRAIRTGGVACCRLKVGELQSRSHRPHLHIMGREHWLRLQPLAHATGRRLHDKLHALPVEIQVWHMLESDGYNVCPSQDG